MAHFKYKARNSSGEVVTGSLDAQDVKLATRKLQDNKYLIVSLERVEQNDIIKNINNALNRVKIRDLTILSEQMATMFDAGVPIVDTLKSLVKQTENILLKEVMIKVAQDVEGGAKLSYSLGQFPKIFSPFYIGMVHSGEASGKVSENLRFLSSQLKKSYEIRSEVRGALMYPAFIVVGVAVVMLIAVFFILPNLLSVVSEAGIGELPWTTKLLIWGMDVLTNFWYIILAVVAVLALGTVSYLKTESGKYQFDNMLLNFPFFGKIIQKFYLSQFANNLSSLVTGGVPIVESFQMIGDMTNNLVYKEIYLETAEKIKGGQRIISVMSKKKVVPPMVINMLAVGEDTGKVDQILKKLADFYQTEVDNQIKGLVSLIEPIMIVFLGVGVAIIVSAVLLPMYNISSSF